MIALIIILSLIFLLGFLLVYKRYQYWTDRGFLSPTPIFPYGNFKGVATTTTFAEALQNYYREFKGKAPAFGIYCFLSPAIVPTDPELIKHILVKDFDSFHNRGFYYNKKDDPLSANMVTLDHEEWKDVRSKLTPIFTSGKMKMMFGIIDEIGDKFVKILGENLNENLLMNEWLGRFTTDLIGSVAFGIDCNCLENPNAEFRKFERMFFEMTPFRNLKFYFTCAFPELSRFLGIPLISKKAANFFSKVFDETLKCRETNKVIRNDLIQLLIQMKNSKDGKSFTDTELAAQAFLFLVAGLESSSTLMTFCLYEMAINPEIQSRLREEILETLQANNGQLTYENLCGMKYLDMVINESLRKYTPAPVGLRKCSKKYTIPGTKLTIEPGTLIFIPVYALQRDPEFYPDPEKFDPERFSDENKNSKRVFLPFSDGPRICIGKRFGLMESKIGIVKLLSNFEFSVCEETTIPIKFESTNIVLEPKGGLKLNVKLLKNCK